MMEYKTPAAFAVASLLTLLAAASLFLKALVERQVRRQLAPEGPAA
jgi:ABC-type sulfate transport system permease subunit